MNVFTVVIIQSGVEDPNVRIAVFLTYNEAKLFANKMESSMVHIEICMSEIGSETYSIL